jgi:hypothetical protein
MESLLLKVRLSILWIFIGVATWRCVHFMEPNLIESVISGQMRFSTVESLFFTVLWLIPFIMAFLSVTLEDVTNRRVNIILGIVTIASTIFHFILHLIYWLTSYSLLIVGLTVVFAILILWYAWKWPND